MFGRPPPPPPPGIPRNLKYPEVVLFWFRFFFCRVCREEGIFLQERVPYPKCKASAKEAEQWRVMARPGAGGGGGVRGRS